MESYGKIWVVIAVIFVIQTIIFIYIFLLDKKIGKIEKQQMKLKEKEKNIN